MFKKIVVALDGSDQGQKALAKGIELAKTFGAELRLFHAVRGMQLPLNPGLMDEYEKFSRQRQDFFTHAGEDLLNQAKRQAELADIEPAETSIGTGDPASAIVDYVKKTGSDLIVIGSRGLGTVEGMFLGSVSRKVSNLSKTNCLVVKE